MYSSRVRLRRPCGLDMLEALRLGTAAGALNATRRGLGTGTRQEIERLAAHVTITKLRDGGASVCSDPVGTGGP